MLRKLLIGALLIVAMACNKDQNSTPVQGKTETTADSTGVKELQRLLSGDELTAKASGPAAFSSGARATAGNSQLQAAASLIDITPNAGTIWQDPQTGATHLLALRLPNSAGQVVWRSLGTGWEGSEFMIMDKEYYYVVWANAVYRVPKRATNTWALIIPSNGEDITGIAANNFGGFLARGNKFYFFSQTGSLSERSSPQGVIANTRLMAAFTKPNGVSSVFLSTKNGELWQFSNAGSFHWTKALQVNTSLFINNMVGNPMDFILYQNTHNAGPKMYQVDEAGSQKFFSGQMASGYAPLVVNNGHVWVMGSTLQMMSVLGFSKGQVIYNEYGWTGILLACADPKLIF
jgi:hypothetical protein